MIYIYIIIINFGKYPFITQKQSDYIIFKKIFLLFIIREYEYLIGKYSTIKKLL